MKSSNVEIESTSDSTILWKVHLIPPSGSKSDVILVGCYHPLDQKPEGGHWNEETDHGSVKVRHDVNHGGLQFISF